MSWMNHIIGDYSIVLHGETVGTLRIHMAPGLMSVSLHKAYFTT